MKLSKPVLDEETARFFGYQKEFPTLLGWVVATAGCLIFGTILLAGILFILYSIGAIPNPLP